MRLSKRGLNNILILGVLMVIFLFNMQQQSSSPLNLPRSVIADKFTILEIETPDYVISRMGKNWKVTPENRLSNNKLHDIVKHWQTTPLDAFIEQEIDTSLFVIKFYVAEQSLPLIVHLYQLSNDDYALQVEDQPLLSLPAEKISLFLGM